MTLLSTPCREPASSTATTPDRSSCSSVTGSRSTTIRSIRAAAPNVKVIVYSGYVGMLGADKLGGEADGYLDKSEDDEALVALIRSLAGR